MHRPVSCTAKLQTELASKQCVSKFISSSLNLLIEWSGVGVNIMPGESGNIKKIVGQL